MDFTHTNYDFEKEYPKLVRDNIPAIIHNKTGKPADITLAESDEEYLKFLLKKLVEESLEAAKSSEHNNLNEELADVMEVVGAIVKLKGWKLEDILKIQEEKRSKNGGFEKRIILKSLQ